MYGATADKVRCISFLTEIALPLSLDLELCYLNYLPLENDAS